jgi:hypothetical protein
MHGPHTLLTDEITEKPDRLTPLAPLHQPHNLAAVNAVRSLRPDLPQVACFDTAFRRGRALLRSSSASRTNCMVVACAGGAFTACRSFSDRPTPPGGPGICGGTGHRGASGQRRQHVRASGRQKRRHHYGFFHTRRDDDGDEVRQPRPGRRPLPDEIGRPTRRSRRCFPRNRDCSEFRASATTSGGWLWRSPRERGRTSKRLRN